MLVRSSPLSPPKNLAGIELPPTTSDQLVRMLLLHASARLLSRQPHGVLMKVAQRLVFIPSTRWVPEGTIVDALRAAGMSHERFLEVRATIG